MTELKFCHIWLTCADEKEASAIAAVLLAKKLIACAKHLPVGSDFLWKGSVDHNDEVLLVMESRLDLFELAEAEVAKIHSYETFVMSATPIEKLSQKATNWLGQSLN